MAMEMKIEIIKRETIKPSSPTPHNKRNFKLSFLDQLAPVGYAPLLLFYTKDGDNNQAAQTSHRLKTSLCKILTHFYPLAGRIKDSATIIECNDDGVDFVEAKVNCHLLDILKQPDGEVLKLFLPGARTSGFLLLAQLTFFNCGGMVISLCISHKLADAASLSTFIKGWTAMALESSDEATIPEFNAVSLFPPKNNSSVMNTAVKLMPPQGNVRKRFVFDASKLDALKAKASSASVQQPTRVEAVLALIWKCSMTASRSNSGFLSKPSLLTQIVNLRKRMVPPLPESSIGNFLGSYAAQYEESEIELHSLVCQLRRGLEDFCENYAKRLLVDIDASSVILESLKVVENMNKRNEDMESYLCTSWCRFPLYEADFGWGKPTWMSIAGSPYKNFFWLMDARSGGIEAWVSLSEQDMALFERDEKLLAFACLNPSVL